MVLMIRFWGNGSDFMGDGVWIFTLKWEDYRKVYRKILGEFCVALIFFYFGNGKVR